MGEKLPPQPGNFRGCFGCGDQNVRGLGLQFEAEGRTVLAKTQISDTYAGYSEFVHGGIVATIIDEAMGWAMWHLAGSYGVTQSLQIEYRRPVRIGRDIVVRAEVADETGNNVTVAARLEDERGRLLARGKGHWVKVRAERATKN